MHVHAKLEGPIIKTDMIDQRLPLRAGFPNFLTLRLIPGVLMITAFSLTTAIGQTGDRSKNNPYSPSPASRTEMKDRSVPQIAQIARVAKQAVTRDDNMRPFVAPSELKNDRKYTEKSRLSLTEIYKIGVGDVLRISLTNVPGGLNRYVVREDGTIDYPLAGGDIVVEGRTVNEVVASLRSRITLFQEPSVEVKLHSYGSHEVAVTGLVNNPGIKNLQREAMPLFAIRAEAVVDTKATTVSIARGPSGTVETHELRDPATENIVIYPGDKLDFFATTKNELR